MPAAAGLEPRQLWIFPTSTSTYVGAPSCTPTVLPSNGVIVFNTNTTITLSSNVIFTPQCTGTRNHTIPGGSSPNMGFQYPFYTSVTPQVYVIATATVIAWMLVVMLVITPRTFFVGNGGGAPSFLSRHGIISGSAGGVTSGATVTGVGSRPLLQKMAALTVAISLTIATAETFEVAENQYDNGYMNAYAMRVAVTGSLEIRIIRVISQIFLWLAQVQTLVRLFPRQKEKVTIKWVGFALILMDIVFVCLRSFWVKSERQIGWFVSAIPALSYLFALALSMLYAVWVMYYSLTKWRYAFYHPKMKNICLVALLSLLSILMPIVFFVADIAQQSAAGWADFLTWVGSAAASVIVWEWVERIEALERDEKQDGILGREIFDGDEMLEATPSRGNGQTASRRFANALARTTTGQGLQGMAKRLKRSNTARDKRRVHLPLGRIHEQDFESTDAFAGAITGLSDDHTTPTLPSAAVTPSGRVDEASATSTEYNVRYHTDKTLGDQQSGANGDQSARSEERAKLDFSVSDEKENLSSDSSTKSKNTSTKNDFAPRGNKILLAWHALTQSLKRDLAQSPAEVRNARRASNPGPLENEKVAQQPPHVYPKWDVKSRLGDFAAQQGEKFRERNEEKQVKMFLPVTVIPAQPRGRTWSPMILESQPTATASVSPRHHTGEPAAGTVHFSDSLTARNEIHQTISRQPDSDSRRDADNVVDPYASPSDGLSERAASKTEYDAG